MIIYECQQIVLNKRFHRAIIIETTQGAIALPYLTNGFKAQKGGIAMEFRLDDALARADKLITIAQAVVEAVRLVKSAIG